MVDWEILNDEGKYLGRHDTTSAETAFCRCMMVLGTEVNESEVKVTPLEKGLYRITYSGKQFFASDATKPRPKIVN